ncbi:MAG: protein kinase [Myxococcota bacterium]
MDPATHPHEVLDGPHDVGTEQRWRVRLADGRVAVVGQLAPDLARDESIRRRYVRDQERVAALGVHAVLAPFALGPAPDPRAPQADAPWRIRLAPDADALADILQRAPLGLEEFASLFAALADAVHAVHRGGAVLRDLRPSQVLRTRDGHVLLCDIGLARVDVLSSHTASSLLLQGSPYAAPEQLFRTTVDQRSDLYSLGALMWHALTGALPFDDGPLLRERPPLPDLAALRPDAPASLRALLPSLLEAEPSLRPPSATEIAWVLRGGAALALRDETVRCQHCGASLRVGQRLCLSCGRVGTRFEHVHGQGWGLELSSLSEDARQLKWLQQFLGDTSRQPMRSPEFIIGNVHLYDDDEKVGRIRLPARLYTQLTEDSALALRDAMQAEGLKVRLVSPNASRRAGMLVLFAIAAVMLLSFASSAVGVSAAYVAVPGVIASLVLLSRWNNIVSDQRTPGSFRLRDTPAALPASDPLVARLAALLSPAPPPDVRAVVADLALIVQRLVDHRASLHAVERAEVDVLTEPLEPLVAAIERGVGQLVQVSSEISELDEGAMVRALAASEARGDSDDVRAPILSGLDRLRGLEDQRGHGFHRLLETRALLQRTVELGLRVHDPQAQHERDLQTALATLSG